MVLKTSYRILVSGGLLFFSCSLLAKKPANIIESFVIKKNFIKICPNASFKEAWLRQDEFFAHYEDDINLEKLPYSIALLPFILNIYPIVWISGKSYTIDCMDEDTYYSLERIKKVLQRLYPHTPFSGKLIPKVLVKNWPPVPLVDSATHVALLFSSGLDSTAVSFEYCDKKQLLITAQGQGDLPVGNTDLWNVRKKMLIDYAHQYGHTNAFVTCNYSEFYRWGAIESLHPEITGLRLDTLEGIGMLGVAAPILFTKGYPTLLIGSSNRWDYPVPTAACPIVDETLTTASALSLKHKHFDLDRFDKVKLIVDTVKKRGVKIPYMKVCDGNNQFDSVNHGGNSNCCSHCTKCMTVINALAALGENPVPYGFNVTPQEIEKRTKAFLKKGIGYWTKWSFCTMQQSLKLLPNLPKTSQWLLTYDFKQVPSEGWDGKKVPVDWHTFKDLAPSTVIIPETIEYYHD